MSTLAADRIASIQKNGRTVTVNGCPVMADGMRFLPSAPITPGSIITAPGEGATQARRYIVTEVTQHIGYLAAEVQPITTDYVAYDPVTGESIGSGPYASRSNPPGILVPAASAPPVGSLFDPWGNARMVKSVIDVTITGGVAVLTLGEPPPEYL